MRPLIRCLLLCFVFAHAAFAANSHTRDVLDSWSRRMSETSAALKAEEYQRALKLANRTIGEMVEMLGPGEASAELFGIALTQKAVAHAGLGETSEALWYWQLVSNLHPTVAEREASSCGAPGEMLLASSIEVPPMPGVGKTITPPEVRKRVKPKFPHGANYYRVAGDLEVEVIITPDGKACSPRIVKALAAPTLSYVALEAVKRWKFEPARAGGSAVPMVFNLTVNYKGR
ncbi:MAG TPA: energy transducer TonB [Thermoanaerobaculia bacterium]|nr:energy transducer TonB [Thermoanaerobaculia bacterium]